MKRKLSLLYILIGMSFFAQAQLKPLIDSVLAIAKRTSMYTESVNWVELQQTVHKKAENAQTMADLKPAFEALLNGIRDHHGKVIDAKTYSPIAYFTDYKNKRHTDNRVMDLEIWKQVNDPKATFSYKILNNRIGYLKIVGIGPNVNIQDEAERIRKAVLKLTKKKVDKWIVDLRYNGGGNMYPMVAGIAPLIGDGIVGKLVNENNDTLYTWRITNGNFVYDVPNVVTLPNKPILKTPPKIAVLTSRWTASSGEVVATTLKGRKNTKFFGEATGGYATNVGWEPISDALILNISTGIFCDRNGTIYTINIPVDVEIPFEVVKDPEKDVCIKEAKKWLLEK